MVTAPEKILVAVLLVLLGVSIAIMYVPADTAVQIARGVCIALVLVMLIGVVFPARRYLRRRAERHESAPEGDDG